MEGAERRMACRNAVAYEGAAARGMTCEGAAAFGTGRCAARDGARTMAKFHYYVRSGR